MPLYSTGLEGSLPEKRSEIEQFIDQTASRISGTHLSSRLVCTGRCAVTDITRLLSAILGSRRY